MGERQLITGTFSGAPSYSTMKTHRYRISTTGIDFDLIVRLATALREHEATTRHTNGDPMVQANLVLEQIMHTTTLSPAEERFLVDSVVVGVAITNETNAPF